MRVSHCGRMLAVLAAVGGCLGSIGCVTSSGPNAGPWATNLSFPIPVTPYMSKQYEDQQYWHERYARVPIIGPITEGGPAIALDPPSDDEIMRALEKARPLQGGLPMLHTVHRDNVRIVIEPIADYVDPPRFYPLVGPAQLHHAHYKCTVYFSETTRVGWPFPHTLRDEEAAEVVYIDHNHLHIVGGGEGTPASNY